jgi:hypothetical protein
MITTIGTTFPFSWQYGPEEIEIVKSTANQISQHFQSQKNLLINTTWFGPQFSNGEWNKVLDLCQQGYTFDNLFLLSVIDPLYLDKESLKFIEDKLQVKKTYRIGMFEDSEFEWNFHASVMDDLTPKYNIEDIVLKVPEHVYICYQRKPRLHRIEITEILLREGLDKHGVVTLGAGDEVEMSVWSEGLKFLALKIDDDPGNYKHNGKDTDFAGIPNDLVTLGRLDIWQRHFLNIVSETEFNQWSPRFITEKTWKPIIGLRPFVIHGQTRIYSWLRVNGFKTFNHYWPHISMEESDNQHESVVSVLHWLCDIPRQNLSDMYNDMLPDLLYNRERFFEFSKEQKHKINHLFDSTINYVAVNKEIA